MWNIININLPVLLTVPYTHTASQVQEYFDSNQEAIKTMLFKMVIEGYEISKGKY